MKTKKTICLLLLTLLMLPANAFAAVDVAPPNEVSAQASRFGPVWNEWPIDVGDEIQLQVYLTNVTEEPLDSAVVDLIIWAEEEYNPGFPSSAFVAKMSGNELPTSTDLGEYTYLATNISNGVDYLSGSFIRPGSFTIYAALADEIGSGSTVADRISNTIKLRSTDSNPSVYDPTPAPDSDDKDSTTTKPSDTTKPTPDKKTTIIMSLANQTLQKDGQITKLDTAPIIQDGRTYLPFRALGEALGAEINYSSATSTITAKLDGRTVTMSIGSNQMTIDKMTVTIDAPPFIQDSRTMIPIRAAAEAFEFEVEAATNQAGTVTDVIIKK